MTEVAVGEPELDVFAQTRATLQRAFPARGRDYCVTFGVGSGGRATIYVLVFDANFVGEIEDQLRGVERRNIPLVTTLNSWPLAAAL